MIYWHSVGLMMWQSGENHVANNYIHHMPRHAISLSGVRVPYFEQRCENREICGSLRRPEIGNRKTWDEFRPFLHTKNNVVEYNEVERVLQKLGDGAGINVTGAWEHKSANNIINNYAIDILPRGHFRIGAAVFYTFAVGPQQVAKSKIEHNLYHCGGVEETPTPKFLQTIQAQGVSTTDVYADPMFESLEPPALKMGIKQIDLGGAGLTRLFRNGSAVERWIMYRRSFLAILPASLKVAMAQAQQPDRESPPNRHKVPGTLSLRGAPARRAAARQRQDPGLRRGTALGSGADRHHYH